MQMCHAVPIIGGGNSVMPGATLEFASVCLQNALTILAEAGISGIDIIESKKNVKNNVSTYAFAFKICFTIVLWFCCRRHFSQWPLQLDR